MFTLDITPHVSNPFPLAGILLHGSSVEIWLREIAYLKLELSRTEVYPLPGTEANTLWGCLLVPEQMKAGDIGRNSYCQLLAGVLFIPEKTTIYPHISDAELVKLAASKRYLFHPAIGLCELEQPVVWEDLIQPITPTPLETTSPATSVFIPRKVRSYRIVPANPDESLKELEEKVVPIPMKFANKPLSLVEKVKLAFYRMLWPKKAGEEGGKYEKTPLLSRLETMMPSAAGKMMLDMEALEARNQKEVDKLLDMLKRNLDEALKYAIPLDDNGSTRGGEKDTFSVSHRWSDFSLFGNQNTHGGSGAVILKNGYEQLQAQYRRTAEELISRKEYLKASFVYLKLLKDYYSAATTLETGKLYGEAASVYLKYIQNKPKAAECYEKGNMTGEAIRLYQEMDGYDEKIGDLYVKTGNRKEAVCYYVRVADAYKQTHQYVKAALLYRNKMNEAARGQRLLLEGWRTNKDALNCMGVYLDNIPDQQAEAEIAELYRDDVDASNREKFLKALSGEYARRKELHGFIRDIAYEIIAEQMPADKNIVTELMAFNRKDPQLTKDTIRFKLNVKKQA